MKKNGNSDDSGTLVRIRWRKINKSWYKVPYIAWSKSTHDWRGEGRCRELRNRASKVKRLEKLFLQHAPIHDLGSAFLEVILPKNIAHFSIQPTLHSITHFDLNISSINQNINVSRTKTFQNFCLPSLIPYFCFLFLIYTFRIQYLLQFLYKIFCKNTNITFNHNVWMSIHHWIRRKMKVWNQFECPNFKCKKKNTNNWNFKKSRL